MTAERLAAKLCAAYGPAEAFWRVMGHVRARLVSGDNERALGFWRAVRTAIAERIGRTEVWS